MRKLAALAMAAALCSAAVPARADVKQGVDAWSQGDFVRAVAIWRPLAEAGDADAQYNLGQAYKLGRGVPANMETALDWYRKAASQGHDRAGATYGILMFVQGYKAVAMPYLRRAADNGEPRAQYLMGTALFNGDSVDRDWVQAYAYMRRAASSGLPQARTSLAAMERHLADGDKAKGIALAKGLAAAKGMPDMPRQATAPDADIAAVAPSPPEPAAQPQPRAVQPSHSGTWRVQLGAFSEQRRAAEYWRALSRRLPALARFEARFEQAGSLTRLQAGPLATKTDARKLCDAVAAAGEACIVKGG